MQAKGTLASHDEPHMQFSPLCVIAMARPYERSNNKGRFDGRWRERTQQSKTQNRRHVQRKSQSRTRQKESREKEREKIAQGKFHQHHTGEGGMSELKAVWGCNVATRKSIPVPVWRPKRKTYSRVLWSAAAAADIALAVVDVRV